MKTALRKLYTTQKQQKPCGAQKQREDDSTEKPRKHLPASLQPSVQGSLVPRRIPLEGFHATNKGQQENPGRPPHQFTKDDREEKQQSESN